MILLYSSKMITKRAAWTSMECMPKDNSEACNNINADGIQNVIGE